MKQTLPIFFILEMLSACNSNCQHCLRKTGQRSQKFKLSFNSFNKILDDLTMFKERHSNIELKISGGEPTLWKEGSKKIEDILTTCAEREIPYALVSNGKRFIDQKYCEQFIAKYKSKTKNPLKIYFTIDPWHDNYDFETSSSPVLDTISDVLHDEIQKQELEIIVQSTLSQTSQYNVSMAFIKRYAAKGFHFMINPLLPWGAAHNKQDIVPSMFLWSTEKETLGEYRKFLFIYGKNRNFWKTEDEFENLTNCEIFLRFNSCGKTIAIHNGAYYYCMAHTGKKEFKIANVGDFNFDKREEFCKQQRLVNKMRSIQLKALKELVPPLEDQKFAMGYGMCGICVEMENKIWQYEKTK